MQSMVCLLFGPCQAGPGRKVSFSALPSVGYRNVKFPTNHAMRAIGVPKRAYDVAIQVHDIAVRVHDVVLKPH
jgi:hypothetical protein